MADLATHTFGLGQAKQAIDAVAGRAGDAIHVSILPDA
jgi:hypothetical protein